MKMTRKLVGYLVLALSLAGAAAAQEKPPATSQEKPAADLKASVPLKVQLVFSEFDGEKKVSSMPYTLSGIASLDRSWALSSIRMGLKVPIQTGQNQIQYMDVGTNIDARSEPQPEGRFHVSIQVRRSSVHTLEGATVTTGEASGRPVLREFTAGFDFFLRDGQTMQTTAATDPVSGHTLRLDVTLNVVK